ncbi:MAG: sulfatase-like hydrolase/transferase [Verrucomicrobiaceae bacterium]
MSQPFRCVLSVVAAFCFLLPAEGSRPNILVIIADDLGYADLGFNGAKDIPTPHLDELAKGGTICQSGYVAHPFCGPSRVALMTGRYPHAEGMPFNVPETGTLGIEEGQYLMSEMLRDAGYRTGIVGKWHLGLEPQYHPNKHGFDDFYGFVGGGHNYFPATYAAELERRVKRGRATEYVTPLERNGKPVEEEGYLTDILSREAGRFVKESAKDEKPFFLYLAYNAPHTPMEAKEEDLATLAGITDGKRRVYAAMVHAVDRGVGEVVAALKESGQYEETLIVFLSDNGGKVVTGADNTPLKMGKGSVYEGGVRVPMFLHWPKEVKAGRKFAYPVSALDFYPTFAGLAGVELPEGKELDGVNLWEDFQAGRDPRGEKALFFARHREQHTEVGARLNGWKIFRYGTTGDWQLYDLKEDVGETKDVSAKHPELVESMVKGVAQWTKTHQAPKWFDSPEFEAAWEKNGMPHFEEMVRVAK